MKNASNLTHTQGSGGRPRSMPGFMSKEVVHNEFSRQRPGRGESLTENRRPGDTDSQPTNWAKRPVWEKGI